LSNEQSYTTSAIALGIVDASNTEPLKRMSNQLFIRHFTEKKYSPGLYKEDSVLFYDDDNNDN
jgi:hypothetical protein